MEAVSCKEVTKQSNNSQFRKGLRGVGNRFICEVLGLKYSAPQVLWTQSLWLVCSSEDFLSQQIR